MRSDNRSIAYHPPRKIPRHVRVIVVNVWVWTELNPDATTSVTTAISAILMFVQLGSRQVSQSSGRVLIAEVVLLPKQSRWN